MSSIIPLPYFAPWQTGFARYSTQVVTPSLNNIGAGQKVATLDIPSGQYWRIIAWSAEFDTNATVKTRTLEFKVVTTDGTTVFDTGFPAVMTASQLSLITIGPNVSTFANTTNPAIVYQNLAIPDVLWQPGMEFQLVLGSTVAGDQVLPATNAVLVEVYTEDYQPTVAPVVTTTPLML